MDRKKLKGKSKKSVEIEIWGYMQFHTNVERLNRTILNWWEYFWEPKRFSLHFLSTFIFTIHKSVPKRQSCSLGHLSKRKIFIFRSSAFCIHVRVSVTHKLSNWFSASMDDNGWTKVFITFFRRFIERTLFMIVEFVEWIKMNFIVVKNQISREREKLIN